MESLEIIVNSQKAINDCCDALREDVWGIADYFSEWFNISKLSYHDSMTCILGSKEASVVKLSIRSCQIFGKTNITDFKKSPVLYIITVSSKWNSEPEKIFRHVLEECNIFSINVMNF